MRLSFSIACSIEIGYLVPIPSLENWKFHNDTKEDIPQVLLYWGLEIVIQCPVNNLYGTYMLVAGWILLYWKEL